MAVGLDADMPIGIERTTAETADGPSCTDNIRNLTAQFVRAPVVGRTLHLIAAFLADRGDDHKSFPRAIESKRKPSRPEVDVGGRRKHGRRLGVIEGKTLILITLISKDGFDACAERSELLLFHPDGGGVAH